MEWGAAGGLSARAALGRQAVSGAHHDPIIEERSWDRYHPFRFRAIRFRNPASVRQFATSVFVVPPRRAVATPKRI